MAPQMLMEKTASSRLGLPWSVPTTEKPPPVPVRRKKPTQTVEASTFRSLPSPLRVPLQVEPNVPPLEFLPETSISGDDSFTATTAASSQRSTSQRSNALSPPG